ncbi:MAG TPA: hypothetical protein VL989_00575 [Candidatus Sulfotelmatobacter sp.]|nr:hypothetical protein [Candidatus Sulfotelmatobacter sp.]
MRLNLKLLVLQLLLVLVLVVLDSSRPYSNSLVDVSWPNCKSTLDSTQYLYGIIGVNGGLDFKPNPCLSKETLWMANYALYINTGYPGRFYGIKFESYPLKCLSSNYNCLAYNYGYNASLYSVRYASSQGAHALYWWLDVETDNSWTLHPRINRQVILGAIEAIKDNVPFARVGIYSDPPQWNFLTNNWQSRKDVWIGSGSLSAFDADSACLSPTFTGGEALLTQYTLRLDQNYVCSNNFLKMFYLNY